MRIIQDECVAGREGASEFYGGTARFGENVQVHTGRLFVVLLTIVAYVTALRAPQGIFDVAVQYAFSGYSALSPLLVAALFWKRRRGVGGVRRDLHLPGAWRARVVRAAAGRTDDAHLVRADDREFARDSAAFPCDDPAVLVIGRTPHPRGDPRFRAPPGRSLRPPSRRTDAG